MLNQQIIPWIEANRARPFFLFVHYFDVHWDYDPPPPYDTMFDADYQGPDLRPFLDNPAIHAGMPKRHLDHLIALYDGEIRFTDEMVYGLACVRCGVDYRVEDRRHVVVAHMSGGQMMACAGECADSYTGCPEGLDDELPLSHRLPAVRAELLTRAGDAEAARAAYDVAIDRCGNDAERALLQARRDALRGA